MIWIHEISPRLGIVVNRKLTRRSRRRDRYQRVSQEDLRLAPGWDSAPDGQEIAERVTCFRIARSGEIAVIPRIWHRRTQRQDTSNSGWSSTFEKAKAQRALRLVAVQVMLDSERNDEQHQRRQYSAQRFEFFEEFSEAFVPLLGPDFHRNLQTLSPSYPRCRQRASLCSCEHPADTS